MTNEQKDKLIFESLFNVPPRNHIVEAFKKNSWLNWLKKQHSELEIYKLLYTGISGVNYTDINFEEYFKLKSLKLKIISAKQLVDRWYLRTTDFIFNSSHKKIIDDVVLSELKQKDKNLTNTLWGAKLHFYDYMPIDKGLAISELGLQKNNYNGRAIAIFPM